MSNLKFYEYVENELVLRPHSSLIFSGGEVHVNCNLLGRRDAEGIIVARLQSSDDIMELLLLTDALREQGFDHIDLFMPYIPYARQDRYCAGGDAFSLKVFAGLVNSRDFAEVIVLDPHSDVATALIDRCRPAGGCGAERR